ncbi:MAG: NAD(+)/NADH kinase [Clostridiales Family XIII bacterium]|jgi:NAD+ kinase|nr:NAD(+)/NADH kinase [Clostridiales Family XIII bacterium]
MKKSRIVNIFKNDNPDSAQIEERFKHRLEAAGFSVPGGFDPEAELLVCIGGDGALLNSLASLEFPEIPIIGVNTGHLGFFQDLQPHEMDEFISLYQSGDYKIQRLKTVSAEIVCAENDWADNTRMDNACADNARMDNACADNARMDNVCADNKTSYVMGLNEIVIRGAHSHVASLNIYIGESFVETFRGDGVVVATPAGSTAYNYALGGSIVDPRLDLLQVTPIAPINNSSYRSFTSGILLPPHMSVNIFPEYTKKKDILIAADGIEKMYSSVAHIHVGFSGSTVQLLRLSNYDFWNKVKIKLL